MTSKSGQLLDVESTTQFESPLVRPGSPGRGTHWNVNHRSGRLANRRRESEGAQEYIDPQPKKGKSGKRRALDQGQGETASQSISHQADPQNQYNFRHARRRVPRHGLQDGQASGDAPQMTRWSERRRGEEFKRNWGLLGDLPTEIVDCIIEYIVCNRENRIELSVQDPDAQRACSGALREHISDENRNPVRNAVSLLCVNKAIYDIAAPIWYGQMLCVYCPEVVHRLVQSLRPATFRMVRHVELNTMYDSTREPPASSINLTDAMGLLHRANLLHLSFRSLWGFIPDSLPLTGALRKHIFEVAKREKQLHSFGWSVEVDAFIQKEMNLVAGSPHWMSLCAAEMARHVYQNMGLCNLLMHFWRTSNLSHLEGPNFVKRFLKVYQEVAVVLDFALVKTDGLYFQYFFERGAFTNPERIQALLTIFCERLGKLLALRKEWEDRKRKLPKRGKMSTSKRWEVTPEELERWQKLLVPSEVEGQEDAEVEEEEAIWPMGPEWLYDAVKEANNWFEEPYYKWLRGPVVTCL